jgi:hypothetical protein
MGLVAQSLSHDPVLPGAITGTPLVLVFWCLIAIGVAASIFAFARLARRNSRKPGLLSLHFLLTQISLVLILIFLIAARHLAGLVYPEGRTGLPLVYFFTLTCIGLLALAYQHSSRPWVIAGMLMQILFIARFATQLSVTWYGPWRYDSSTKRIFRTIQQLAPARPIRVSSSWFYVPALEFYREISGDANIEPIQSVIPMRLSGFDFYVLSGDERNLPEAAGLVTILRDPTSEATLARSAPEGSPR